MENQPAIEMFNVKNETKMREWDKETWGLIQQSCYNIQIISGKWPFLGQEADDTQAVLMREAYVEHRRQSISTVRVATAAERSDQCGCEEFREMKGVAESNWTSTYQHLCHGW